MTQITKKTVNPDFRQHLKNIFCKKKAEVPPNQRKQFEGFFIELPAHHPLLDYQKKYPQYDRFLPLLAAHINPREVIVDIGANVGDSLAAMVEVNPEPTYFCIEADDAFYRYLVENIERMVHTAPSLDIETANAFIGKNITNISLEGTAGTKHASANNTGAIQAVTLDQLIEKKPTHKIALLKSDTDGHDYDVLESSMATIEKHQPALFFECQPDQEHQKSSYEKTILKLQALGYEDWTLFDNFGAVVVRTPDFQIIRQLRR